MDQGLAAYVAAPWAVQTSERVLAMYKIVRADAIGVVNAMVGEPSSCDGECHVPTNWPCMALYLRIARALGTKQAKVEKCKSAVRNILIFPKEKGLKTGMKKG